MIVKCRVAVLIAVALLVALVVPIFALQHGTIFSFVHDESTRISETHVDHDPISIVGNVDFLNQAFAEGWPGTGTESDPIIISGLRIQYSGHMFRVIDSDLHFEFTDNILNGIDQTWCGLYIANSSNGKVINNTIYNAAAGIHVLWINDTVITSNKVFENSNAGIAFERACHRNNISWNSVHSNFYFGIGLDYNSTANVVHNNLITNTLGNGVMLWDDSYLNQIYNNTIFENNGSGVTIRGHHQRVYDNVIANNTQDGILVSASFCQIENNTLLGNSRSGVHMYTFWDDEVGNEISGNSILSNGRYAVDIGARCDNNTVEYNNIIDNCEGSQVCDNGLHNVIRHNYWNPWNATDTDFNGIVDYPYLALGSSENVDSSPALEPFDGLPTDYVFSPNAASEVQDSDSQPYEAIFVASVGILIVALAVWRLRKRDFS
ncbi:MAG: right-handed parallel beta-helix repeat-containing protein [Candidatus Thorarchaeota archaeon]|nr:MAG: right-handed parallel beta-helix repeat-containing protein [Candidatus Thorarchaeota archaeon]